MDTIPAYVFGRGLEVLAWNRLGGGLTFDFDTMVAAERNMGRLYFLDPRAPDFFPEWRHGAGETAANLRAEAGRYPDDPDLSALVGELSVRSDMFRRLWARQSVKEKSYGTVVWMRSLSADFHGTFTGAWPVRGNPYRPRVVWRSCSPQPSSSESGMSPCLVPITVK